MRSILTITLAVLISSILMAPAESRERLRLTEEGYVELEAPGQGAEDYDQLAQQDSDYGVRPSEAASIAKQVVPGARVVGVRLLSNGYYAVTLRAKGSVTRVLVNASDGSIR